MTGEAQACVSRMQDLGNLLTGTLEIGVTYSFSPILTETIIDFMKLHPGVKLNIHYKPMAELMGLLFAHIILLRTFDGGPHIDLGFRVFEYGEICLWIVLLGTWASDTFAYFFGRAFGKTPFCSVSPKKSFEGAVCGFVGCFVTVLFLCIICLGIALWHAVAVALAVAIFAPVGDLIESIVKRSFDIKDSGKIFPGHGGVLDRFDSLLFTAPVVYYLLMIISALSMFQE